MPALKEDKKIIEGATVLNSSSLLVKLAKSGVIATEAKYHRKCIVMFMEQYKIKKKHQIQQPQGFFHQLYCIISTGHQLHEEYYKIVTDLCSISNLVK